VKHVVGLDAEDDALLAFPAGGIRVDAEVLLGQRVDVLVGALVRSSTIGPATCTYSYWFARSATVSPMRPCLRASAGHVRPSAEFSSIWPASLTSTHTGVTSALPSSRGTPT